MEFRFRAIDNKPPAAAAITSERPSDRPPQDDFSNAELLKQKIKEEIVIREIASRRLLEAEIRRELILEQELAMLRATNRTEEAALIDEQSAVRLLDQRLNRSAPAVLSSSSSLLNWLPIRPFLQPQKEKLKEEPQMEETKRLDDEKKRCFILRKPDPEIFLAKKRKAKEADKDDDKEAMKLSGSKKPAHEKYICKTCNISTTSEITFKNHLEGKKHKTKEGRALQSKEALNRLPTKKGLKGLDLRPETQQSTLQNKGDFKYRCQMCEKGSHSMVVMETHYVGRKHRARVLKLGEFKLDEQKELQGLVSVRPPIWQTYVEKGKTVMEEKMCESDEAESKERKIVEIEDDEDEEGKKEEDKKEKEKDPPKIITYTRRGKRDNWDSGPNSTGEQGGGE